MPQTEPGDNSRYLRHALAVYQLPAIDISDAEQVEERIQWYFSHCMENDMKPTVTGLCNALGIDMDTFRRWGNGTYREKTHSGMVKKAYAVLHELWEDYMLNGKINPVAGIFLGKNNFGYTDKQELEVKPVNPMAEGLSTPEEIEQKYAQLPRTEPLSLDAGRTEPEQAGSELLTASEAAEGLI